VQEYPPRHFRGANLRILEVFCRASAFASECDRHIERHGLTIQSGESTKANPAVAMRAQAWTEIRNSAAKLRLTISSLQRADSAKARPSERHSLTKPWEA
jgi:P27 family predicted phage terminase small subunit